MPTQKNILVCPLDWGLGHATRCVPVIKSLTEAGANVIIASDKRPLAFLQKEFPELEFVNFPGYDIKYTTGKLMNIKMGLYAPVILFKIFREHKLLKKIIRDKNIDIVISDNRFGLWNKHVMSVYICHQLWVKIPKPFTFLESVLYKLNHFFIRHYNHCWIPDFEGEGNLSGSLSHFKRLPLNASYIGPLSRFSYIQSRQPEKMNHDVAVILSGPEPQRSILENILTNQLNHSDFNAIIIRGAPEENTEKTLGSNITLFSHLSTQEMAEKILSANLIICRPGYSGIMDLACLGKKALFIPTPGQTEQEYLAEYFSKKNLFLTKKQENINLIKDINEALRKEGLSISFDYTDLKRKINQLLNS